MSFSCRSHSEGSGTFLALHLLLIWGLRICSLCLLKVLLFGSAVTDVPQELGVWAEHPASLYGLLSFPGLGWEPHVPQDWSLPLWGGFWGSAYPRAPCACVPGSRHTCGPWMERLCHPNALHPSPCWCELTRCLPHLSPRRKVVLLSPGLRALVSWLLFSGWWWGVAFLRSAPQASSFYSLLISCIRERISVLLAPKCSLSSVSSL